MSVPFEGVIAARMHLRQEMRRTTDAATRQAIQQALSDPDFASEIAASGMTALGYSVDGEALPSGWLAKLFQWFITNGPAIIAMILAIFGIPIPTPTPTPA